MASDLRKSPIGDKGTKNTWMPMAPSMSEKEAGAITIPSFEPTEFTGN
jgi:hypothetical protein